MATQNLARVAIVGRMNVGKSTLFNRILRYKKSIVLDYDGVTRDPLFEQVVWNGHSFDLIDTGGVGCNRRNDELDRAAQEKSMEYARYPIIVKDNTFFVAQDSIKES